MTIYNKLVRDNIPEIILNNGEIPKVRTLSDDEFLKELEKKLVEEINEYILSKDETELADIAEVLFAICRARNISEDRLLELRESKNAKNGAFNRKIFLISKE